METSLRSELNCARFGESEPGAELAFKHPGAQPQYTRVSGLLEIRAWEQ